MRCSLVAISVATLMVPVSGIATAKTVASVPAVRFENDNADKASLQEAFEAAFNTQVAPGGKAEIEKTVGDAKYTFTPVALFRVSGTLYVLLSTGSSETDGHSETGTNAVHYLHSMEGGWHKAGEWFGLGSGGTWGNGATEWKLVRGLGTNPFLQTSGGGTWQGCTVSQATLTELAPSGPKDRATFVDHNSWADGAPGRDFSYDGVITSGARDRSFTVTYTGTKRIAQQYVRKGEKYTLVGNDQIPGC